MIKILYIRCISKTILIIYTKLKYQYNMSLCLEKIEHLDRQLGRKSRSRKWRKNQKNRKIRRINKLEKPIVNKLYAGYEY